MLLPSFLEYAVTVEREQRESLQWLSSERAGWSVPASLSHKVGPDGRLLLYYGDTVVFPLEPQALAVLSSMQRTLRADVSDMLAEPLDPASFHITLHDLAHGPDAEALELHEAECKQFFAKIRLAHGSIRLRSTAIYPSVYTSLVVGLMPVTQSDYEQLSELHSRFESLVALAYWPRFHVTLDYFLPRPLDRHQRSRLAIALAALNPPDLELVIRPADLSYQTFTGMNDYGTRFRLRDIGQ